jgi:hypothetical protein
MANRQKAIYGFRHQPWGDLVRDRPTRIQNHLSRFDVAGGGFIMALHEKCKQATLAIACTATLCLADAAFASQTVESYSFLLCQERGSDQEATREYQDLVGCAAYYGAYDDAEYSSLWVSAAVWQGARLGKRLGVVSGEISARTRDIRTRQLDLHPRCQSDSLIDLNAASRVAMEDNVRSLTRPNGQRFRNGADLSAYVAEVCSAARS